MNKEPKNKNKMKAKVNVKMSLEFSVLPFDSNIKTFEEKLKKTLECMIAKETTSLECSVDYIQTENDKKLEAIVNSEFNAAFCEFIKANPNMKISEAINKFTNK